MANNLSQVGETFDRRLRMRLVLVLHAKMHGVCGCESVCLGRL